MLQKLLAVLLVALIVAQAFFRPQLRLLGKQVDRLVKYAAVAILIFYVGQALFFLSRS